MKDVAIWGAGTWGELAYHYYKNKCNIVCYVDNDSSKWGTELNGIKILSPDILISREFAVVIANKNHESEIIKQLYNCYHNAKFTVFRIQIKNCAYFEDNVHLKDPTELIISFQGGLGNQMFQYALYRNFINLEMSVKADCSSYISPDSMPFELTTVFSNIKIKECSPFQKEFFFNTELCYIEPLDLKYVYKKDIFIMKQGYIEGYHQSYLYAEKVKNDLLEDFKFDFQKEQKLIELKKHFDSNCYIGIHIRRGDYILRNNARIYGHICEKSYYDTAIKYILEKVPNAKLCFFSDDIEWVKKAFHGINGLYIEKKMFANYYNWYDMFLMSLCKHNIIANSSFSWWGAWLNQNPQKIVIAPSKWINTDSMRDICPPDWIRM